MIAGILSRDRLGNLAGSVDLQPRLGTLYSVDG